MRSFVARYAIAITAIVAFAGCAGNQPALSGQPAPPGVAGYVRIVNNNPLDVTVYSIRNGTWTRLATVMSGRSQKLEIRDVDTAFGPLTLGLDPIGSRSRTVLDPISLPYGDTMDLVVQSTIQHSYFRPGGI